MAIVQRSAEFHATLYTCFNQNQMEHRMLE